jgi:hypothetical protein
MIRKYKTNWPSIGIVISRDCVLQQFEPYETISHWEPYVRIYFWRWQFYFGCKVRPQSRLGLWFGRQREKWGWMS